jgi:hypothetical protein
MKPSHLPLPAWLVFLVACAVFGVIAGMSLAALLSS